MSEDTKAIADFTRAIEKEGGKFGDFLARSAAYLDINEAQKAHEDVKIAYAIDENHQAVNYLYGAIQYSLGHYSYAEVYLKRANEIEIVNSFLFYRCDWHIHIDFTWIFKNENFIIFIRLNAVNTVFIRGFSVVWIVFPINLNVHYSIAGSFVAHFPNHFLTEYSSSSK